MENILCKQEAKESWSINPHIRQSRLKTKKIIRDKEGQYIIDQEEDITILNIYAPTRGAPQYIRQTLTDIKGEIDNNTVIVGDFNTPLTPMD